MTTVSVANLRGPAPAGGQSILGLVSGTAGTIVSYDSVVLTIEVTILLGLSFMVGESVAFGAGGGATVAPAAEAVVEEPVGGEAPTSTIDVAVPVPAAPAAAAATPAAEIQQAIQDAMLESPDVAGYTENGRTVQRRSLKDLIEADRYLEAKAARVQGLRQTKARFR